MSAEPFYWGGNGHNTPRGAYAGGCCLKCRRQFNKQTRLRIHLSQCWGRTP